MKRASAILLIALIALSGALLTACGSSPRARADEFVVYLPAEVGDWERNDKETVRLLANTVASKGHVTLVYEGPDDALAYVVVEAHPGVDAAEVALVTRERELRLDGVALDRDRAPQKATATVGQTALVRYALFQEATIVVEIDAIAAEEGAPVGDEAFDELLTMVRNAYAKVAGK
ncbi:MAG: hypothetical protein KJ047_09360 [Anaerolineae bacterium]|nr:hypothetical protein [Anaerolineae bacterium]MEB2287704.1 hypothetical protein [Anaerolineae bacterium]